MQIAIPSPRCRVNDTSPSGSSGQNSDARVYGAGRPMAWYLNHSGSIRKLSEAAVMSHAHHTSTYSSSTRIPVHCMKYVNERMSPSCTRNGVGNQSHQGFLTSRHLLPSFGDCRKTVEDWGTKHAVNILLSYHGNMSVCVAPRHTSCHSTYFRPKLSHLRPSGATLPLARDSDGGVGQVFFHRSIARTLTTDSAGSIGGSCCSHVTDSGSEISWPL